MRKKTLRYLVPCMAMALCSIGFTSCSDDDEGGVPSGPSITFGDSFLTGVGRHEFSYDEEGRCYRAYEPSNDDLIIIDYENGLILSGDIGEEMKISFNGKGYITGMSASWDYEEDGEKYSGSGKMTFSYDGNGHLTEENINSKERYSYKGETSSYSMTSKTAYRWENGDLVSGSMRHEETEDGDDNWAADEFTIRYDETLDNIHKQFPFTFYRVMDNYHDSYIHILGMVGMFGIGPAHLPSSYHKEFNEEGQTWDETSGGSVVYTINSDGYIAGERINGAFYGYDYESFGSASNYVMHAAKSMKSMDRDKKRHRVRDMFMRYRDRK